MNIARYAALLLLPLGAALAAGPASATVAPVTSAFFFSGLCTDCTGTGRGELVLSSYNLGDQITSSNFVSFHYDGSNLVPGGFTITTLSYGVGGTIEAPLPGAENVYIYGTDNYFTSDTSGRWNLGPIGEAVADYGTAGTYSAPAAAVPEPVSLSILALGLAGTAAAFRRRS